MIIDPMTNEIICKVTDTDDGGKKVAKVNDSWFVLNFKLKWKDASGASVQEGGVSSPEAVAKCKPASAKSCQSAWFAEENQRAQIEGGDE